MRNCVSHSLAELFISHFETHAKEKFEYYPRVWFRYVEDVSAIFDTKSGNIKNFISKLNNSFK